VALTVAVLALAAGGAGCSSGNDDTPVVAVGLSTTTTGVLDVGDASPSSLPPVTPADMRSKLQAAIAAKDFCAFYGTVDSSVPDLTNHATVTEGYTVLSDAAAQAGPIVPADIATAWGTVAKAIDDGAAAVRAAQGDIGDPSVGLVFEASDFQDAHAVIERWMGEHC
jgi:hypothetical protein